MNTSLAHANHHLPAADEAEEAPVRLSELDFTDLYIATSGEAHMKGLLDVKDPLYPIPAGAIEDLHVIHQIVCEEGQREDEFTLDHDDVRYRVSKIDDESNPTYVLRRAIDPIPRIGSFKIPKLVMRELALAGRQGSRGLILLSGSTGMGKTTTACSLLQEYLINFGGVAIAIEDPPELKLNGPRGPFGLCYQVRVRNGDFASPLRRAMRQAPRYIFLGEIRDPESAHEALQAANSGHVVVATTHAGTIEEAINRLMKLVTAKVDIGLARDLMADGLSVVTSQEMTRIKALDGRVERRINFKTLFFGEDSGLRTMIREGKTQQIGSIIEAQQMRVANNRPPLDPKGSSKAGAAGR
jgi:Tfp pilus assembly pilus retraction ATPase PilT